MIVVRNCCDTTDLEAHTAECAQARRPLWEAYDRLREQCEQLGLDPDKLLRKPNESPIERAQQAKCTCGMTVCAMCYPVTEAEEQAFDTLSKPSPIERAIKAQAGMQASEVLRRHEEIPAARILRHAADLVEQRAAQRDQPNGEKTMAATVKAFNAIYGTTLTEVQGWHFMELLKMVRSAYGVYVPDDFEDKVAYAALAAEAAEGEKS